MIGFFTSKPRLGLAAILGVFATGGVLAHHTGGAWGGKRIQPLSIASTRTTPERAPREVGWRDQLDLRRAKKVGGELVQTVNAGRVVYTLDPALQESALEVLRSNQVPYGAVVMTDVRSGRVLVLAGHSAADSRVDIESLCLAPWAPAASIFKLVTAAGLLAKGVPAEAQVCYHGGLHGLARHNIEDDARQDTACQSLSNAVAKSLNPVMAKLALRYLGRDALQGWAERLGFNRPASFELPVKPSRAKLPSERLELARAAAGFYHTEMSPLHGAVLASAVASGGLLRWPHVVARVERPGQPNLVPERPRASRVMGTSAARTLGKMMVRTTTMGTARKAFRSRRGQPFLKDVKVAGKTGSLSRQNPYLHYSWFVGYAPADKPEVAFAVLVGNSPLWRIKAHTASRILLQRYFETRRRGTTVAAPEPAPARGKKTSAPRLALR